MSKELKEILKKFSDKSGKIRILIDTYGEEALDATSTNTQLINQCEIISNSLLYEFLAWLFFHHKHIYNAIEEAVKNEKNN